jgi:hypothetical protein
MTDKAMHL